MVEMIRISMVLRRWDGNGLGFRGSTLQQYLVGDGNECVLRDIRVSIGGS